MIIDLPPNRVEVLHLMLDDFAQKLERSDDIDPELSEREYEVLVLLASGRTYLQIAAHCNIKRHTVVSHVNAIYQKLHAQNSCHAVALALSMQLISPEEINPIISQI